MINKLLIAVVIIVVIVFIGFLISSLEINNIQEEKNLDDYVSLAEKWIYENSLTFIERGGSDLEHIRTVGIEKGVYEITFGFNSAFAGYGALKEDEMTAQVITPHVVVVIVEDGKVKSVVIDDIFEETSTEEEKTVKANVFFVVVKDNEEKLIAVERLLFTNEDVEKNTLLQLLFGLTEEEKNSGYTTAIDSNVEINDFYIREKVAYVDFTETLNVSGGSALVTMIRNQIEKTLLQFDTIESVEISIEGETENILQP